MQSFLAFNLELACEIMMSTQKEVLSTQKEIVSTQKEGQLSTQKVVDKYVVFLNLENFSFFNSPPISSINETIHMLVNCYPERLGHLIVYKPPYIMYTVYNTIKGLIDAKTLSKIHFVSGMCILCMYILVCICDILCAYSV